MAPDPALITHRPQIAQFLKEPHIASLATANPKTLQPHAVPVWYEWDGERIWISSFRSTRKIGEIHLNPLVSIAVNSDDPDAPVRGVVFEGQAELVEDRQQGVERGYSIYSRYLGPEGALAAEPQSWLHDPEHLLICLKPASVIVWGFSNQ